MNSPQQNMTDFSGKTIVLGITGGIAAYRSCDLIRELYRRGAQRVIPIMTPSAEAFIPQLTLQSLSQEKVYTSDLAVDEQGVPVHIALAQQADALLIHPATTNTLAKLANGMADNMVTTTFMTFTGKPVVIAPAMNTRMWQHPLTQENLCKLATLDFVEIVQPTAGHLACGETGEGHLADHETVLQYLYRSLHPQQGMYQGIRALVTAGGTQEPIDPVRRITNRSSGKMGIALADELFAMGSHVTLLLAGNQPITRPYEVVWVETVPELAAALDTRFSEADLLLMAAAVSDYAVARPSTEKIKRQGQDTLCLELVANPDLLANLGTRKRDTQKIVGFAAESQDLEQQALEKLRRKNLDAIIANDISRSDIGFNADENEVTLYLADGEARPLPKAPKPQVARGILRTLHEGLYAAPVERRTRHLPLV